MMAECTKVCEGNGECAFIFGQEIFYLASHLGGSRKCGVIFNGPAPSVAAGDARAKEAHSTANMMVMATLAIMAAIVSACLFLPS